MLCLWWRPYLRYRSLKCPRSSLIKMMCLTACSWFLTVRQRLFTRTKLRGREKFAHSHEDQSALIFPRRCASGWWITASQGLPPKGALPIGLLSFLRKTSQPLALLMTWTFSITLLARKEMAVRRWGPQRTLPSRTWSSTRNGLSISQLRRSLSTIILNSASLQRGNTLALEWSSMRVLSEIISKLANIGSRTCCDLPNWLIGKLWMTAWRRASSRQMSLNRRRSPNLTVTQSSPSRTSASSPSWMNLHSNSTWTITRSLRRMKVASAQLPLLTMKKERSRLWKISFSSPSCRSL